MYTQLSGNSYKDFAPLLSRINDLFDDVSNCCGARILKGGVCSDCYEHCSPELNEEEKKLNYLMEMGVDNV